MLKQPTMNLRCVEHDYHDPCIYLITCKVVEGGPRLCGIRMKDGEVSVELTLMGFRVQKAIFHIPETYPSIQIYRYQVMPDHVHLILRVKERLPQGLPLGNVVAAFKSQCSKAYRDLLEGGITSLKTHEPNMTLSSTVESLSGSATLRSPVAPLFEKGFNDRILTGKGQLHAMMAYVKDNPRRLAVKRAHPEFFDIRRGAMVGGNAVDMVGNIQLLDWHLVAVHCRRAWDEQQTRDYQNRCILAARKGAVLVGAFISKAEKAILAEAQREQLPIIRLMQNGFPERYKPIGRDFDECAAGPTHMAEGQYTCRRPNTLSFSQKLMAKSQ